MNAEQTEAANALVSHWEGLSVERRTFVRREAHGLAERLDDLARVVQVPHVVGPGDVIEWASVLPGDVVQYDPFVTLRVTESRRDESRDDAAGTWRIAGSILGRGGEVVGMWAGDVMRAERVTVIVPAVLGRRA